MKPVIAVPGLTPTSPVTLDALVQVTVEPPRTANPAAAPSDRAAEESRDFPEGIGGGPQAAKMNRTSGARMGTRETMDRRDMEVISGYLGLRVRMMCGSIRRAVGNVKNDTIQTYMSPIAMFDYLELGGTILLAQPHQNNRQSSNYCTSCRTHNSYPVIGHSDLLLDRWIDEIEKG